MVLSEIFWSFLLTSIIAMILAIIRMMYKSKCVKVDCLCCHIERDIEQEMKDIETTSTRNNDTRL